MEASDLTQETLQSELFTQVFMQTDLGLEDLIRITKKSDPGVIFQVKSSRDAIRFWDGSTVNRSTLLKQKNNL